MRKLLKGLVLVPIVLAMSAGPAFASAATGQASGNGMSGQGNAVGFNAKANLSGQFQYVSFDQTFKAHCSGYTFYKQYTSPGGYPIVDVHATCTDQNGATVYLEAYFLDRGEPGTRDAERIYFSYVYHFDLDENAADLFIADTYVITNGNIQIHVDPTQPSEINPVFGSGL